jgi:hypothetical protein
MKKLILASLAATAAFVAAAQPPPAMSRMPQSGPPPNVVPPQSPPVYQALPPDAAPPPQAQAPAQPAPLYVYDQKPLQQQPVLITAQQAQSIVDQFRTNYPALGSPRILIYVNRELVDETSGMKLSGHSEQVETTRTDTTGSSSNSPANESVTTHVTAKNNYHDNGQAAPTLADRQTVRDVERLMGRPLRMAGATLVDQRVAAQLIGDRPLGSLTMETEQARKDREAVSQIADVVLEVLISSRNVTVTEISGDRTYPAPDIQATAIRLKDAKIIGQASASDVMNKAGGAANAARNFSVQDITEGTALALMQDMLTAAR